MSLNEIIVNCGDTSNNPDAERAYRAIRAEQGDTAPAGCGKPVGLLHLYRCADCARWLHHSCLVRHFADHGDETRARVARLEEVLLEAIEDDECDWFEDLDADGASCVVRAAAMSDAEWAKDFQFAKQARPTEPCRTCRLRAALAPTEATS